MCRFVAYIGEPVILDEIVCRPAHSLLHQSLHAEHAHSATNGDGFGLGWYDDRDEPATYRQAMPAWSDESLPALCRTLRSPLFFAHVRAATGTPIARQNCHPFRHGRWLFMHNGQIGGYARVRRALEARLPDALQAARRGATDSELLFLLALARIERGEPAAAAVRGVVEDTAALLHERGIDEPLRLCAALSDGRQLHAFRLSSDDSPPTLFLRAAPQHAVVASEPLDDDARWRPLPCGSTLSFDRAALKADEPALA